MNLRRDWRLEFQKNWRYSNRIWKRKLASLVRFIYLFLRKIYITPIKTLGMFFGVMFSKMPIAFSSQLKESLKLTTNMPPLSLGIKVAVDQKRDFTRAQFCYKERLTCEWIKKYYKKGDVIYDVGANIGAVSLVSALYLEKDCEIYAFEPLPPTYNMLFKNIMLNNCDKIITPLNIALSDKVEIDQFHMRSIEAGTSGHNVSGSVIHNENKKILNVFTQTFDSLIDTYGMKQPNHIKIDVDGHDYEVLLGGEKNILNESTLQTILIERNDKEEQIRALVKKYGFVEIELKERKGTIYENLGFIRDNLI